MGSSASIGKAAAATAREPVLRPQRVGDVSQPTPQTVPFEVMETEVVIEGGGLVVDSVDDDRSGSEFLAAPHAAAQSVDQKLAAQPVALLRAVEGQPGEHDDGNGVGHTTTQAGGRGRMRYGTHSEGVVPDDPRSAAQDVSRCCPRSGGHPRSVDEPVVQLYLAAVKAFDAVEVC